MSAHGPGRWLAVVATVAMVAAVVTGLWVLGSPAHQRAVRLDARRVNDLSMLASLVDMYRQTHKALPSNLKQVAGGQRVRKDPLSGTPYQFKITDKDTYQLCARFQLASVSENTTDTDFMALPATHDPRWQHPAGHHCFDRSVKSSR